MVGKSPSSKSGPISCLPLLLVDSVERHLRKKLPTRWDAFGSRLVPLLLIFILTRNRVILQSRIMSLCPHTASLLTTATLDLLKMRMLPTLTFSATEYLKLKTQLFDFYSKAFQVRFYSRTAVDKYFLNKLGGQRLTFLLHDFLLIQLYCGSKSFPFCLMKQKLICPHAFFCSPEKKALTVKYKRIAAIRIFQKQFTRLLCKRKFYHGKVVFRKST